MAFPTMVEYMPPFVGPAGADKEVFGKVALYARATLEASGDGRRVGVRVYMQARQWDDDFSEASGEKLFPDYFTAVPDGWIVDRRINSVSTTRRYLDRTWEEETTFEEGPFVEKWVWFGDRNGEDLGTHTRVQVHFKPMEIKLVPGPDCVPLVSA